MIPSARVQFDDAGARERIRNSLDESLIVEASAGTGKTSELVHRVVRVLQTGRTTIDRIIAVTFTHKAAGEMKLRLRQELDRARAATGDLEEIRNLEDALERLEEASIGTIHSFCAQMLRQRPVEAVVDPAFGELSEQEAARIYRRAFRRWLERRLDESSPGLRRALVRLAWHDGFDAGSPVEQLQEAGRKLVEWRDFPAAWRREPFERQQEIDALIEQAQELAALSQRCRRTNDNLYKSLRPVRDLADAVSRSEAHARGLHIAQSRTPARPRDYDTLEGLLVKLLRDLRRDTKKGSGFFGEGVTRERVLSQREALLVALDDFRRKAGADLAALLRDEMQDLIEEYEELKEHAGKLDFVDLLTRARDLVRDNLEVRRYFQGRFTHVFVDEFQDTDPVQAEILLLLAADDPSEGDWLNVTPAVGKLFVVGDPKQSIYKFRRADVLLYQAVRDALVERGTGIVRLTRSFRAVRPIQECVNAAFEPEMNEDAAAGQAGYVPLEEYAQAIDGQPSVIALPAPKPYGTQRISKIAINACLPEAIVGFVDWLIHESGWKVRDLEDPSRLAPVSARHIAILFRRFTNWGKDLTRDYVRGLEARGIPHLLVGSKSFHRREEVETLRAALAAVEWPDDELSVFATLKGSLFAITDATLLRFRREIGRLHPFRPLPENLAEEFQPVAEALKFLAELHRARNRRPVADTVNLLLEATRAHAGFALRPAGHQVVANVYRVADLARTFESTGGISFRGFVEELEAQAEKAESAEAPVLEESAEGVRLMTVHTAKGLEFPVVVLADMTANLSAREPDKYVDGASGLCATRLLGCAPADLLDREADEKAREIAEGVRVAYVAATRARDLLVVPAVGDGELDGWLSPLNKAIYPAHDRTRLPDLAPGCPRFGETTVLNRPFEYMQEGEFSVKPGQHISRQGTHRVVWWDPQTLRLSVDGNFGLRQEEILAAPEGEQPSGGLKHYEEWKTHRERNLEDGRRMTFDVFSASEALVGPDGFACEVGVERLPKAAGRPAGPRFGTLVHEVLGDLDWKLGQKELDAIVEMRGRILGATQEEMAAAKEAVKQALSHPLLKRARSAERAHREYPVMLRLTDGRMLEGVIDLAFLEGNTWTIVDFKTDADLPPRQEHYQRQLQWYALALTRITSLPSRCYLLSL